MSPDGPTEERVVWRERFQGQHFDFRSKIILTRFDGCEFVKCTLLIDHETGQLAFTGCVFKDSNIDKLEEDEERGLYVRDNFFDDAIVLCDRLNGDGPNDCASFGPTLCAGYSGTWRQQRVEISICS